MDIKSLYDYMRLLAFYPEDRSPVDLVGEEGYFKKVVSQFGMRALRGTAIGQHRAGELVIHDKEQLFRKFLKMKPIKNAVEIGTWRGVSSALIAHYAEKVVTMDIAFHFDPFNVWNYFGVYDKITCCVMPNEVKLEKLKDMEFDFAFVDGMHDFEHVEQDFNAVKKCGRVLFHDYGCGKDFCEGPTRFIDTLPKDEITIEEPFALWEAK